MGKNGIFSLTFCSSALRNVKQINNEINHECIKQLASPDSDSHSSMNIKADQKVIESTRNMLYK